jgi:hypothetical protein
MSRTALFRLITGILYGQRFFAPPLRSSPSSAAVFCAPLASPRRHITALPQEIVSGAFQGQEVVHMAHSLAWIVGLALIELTSLTASYTVAQAVPEDFVIKLERTSCFGRCPVYSVSIDARGNVTYDGTEFVRVVGRQADRIPVSRVAFLAETVDRMRFFELDDRYRQLVMDLPTTFVTVIRGGRFKRIEDYFGAPKSLKDLERQIDDTAGTARWVGGDEATQRSR